MGGGIYSGANVTMLARTTLHDCSAHTLAAGVAAEGSIRMGSIHVEGSEPILVSSEHGLEVARADCTRSPECRFQGQPAVVGALSCSRGEGMEQAAGWARCRTCPEGEVRLAHSENPKCMPCPQIPNVTVVCGPAKIAVPQGAMVQLDSAFSSLSNWYRCPTAQACPGGSVEAGTEPGDAPNITTPMCAAGHEGPGCITCRESYARSDGNVMQCVRCSESTAKAGIYLLLLLGKDVGLFASAAASVASAKNSRSSSGTWLNQLMAFAAVAGIVMSSAMQTRAFQTLKASTQGRLESLQVPVALFQGQSSSATMSCECLLRLLGLPVELYIAHVMVSMLPLILILTLAVIKGRWLALIVGTNVFLSGFTAAFGKYLVSFRVRPESAGGELHWAFLPQGLLGASEETSIALVVLAIALCFLAGLGSWTYAVKNRSLPLQPHVSYLMQAYKPECSAWEVERLGRKMLLSLITAVLPVTLSPALQMLMVSLVLCASLALYDRYLPYKVPSWNAVEKMLLMAALVLIALTSCLVASDRHWAQSVVVLHTLILLIFIMAAAICTGMALLFANAFYTERQEMKEPDSPGA